MDLPVNQQRFSHFQHYSPKTSESLLVVVRVQQFLINALVVSVFLVLVALSIENRIFKKVIGNERVTIYLDILTAFLKKPTLEKTKYINPLKFFNSEFLLNFKIEKIDFLIKEGLYRDALSLCKSAIKDCSRIHSSTFERKDIFHLLSSIEMDITKKLKLKNIER